MKKTVVLILFSCLINTSYCQFKIDTLRLQELQSIVSEIVADSLNNLDYFNHYRPYYQEIDSLWHLIPLDSLHYMEIEKKYKPYDRLKCKFDSLYFASEKKCREYDSTLIQFFINNEKQTERDFFKVFRITIDSVQHCDPLGYYLKIQSELDSLPVIFILKYCDYNFLIGLFNHVFPQHYSYEKILIQLNTVRHENINYPIYPAKSILHIDYLGSEPEVAIEWIYNTSNKKIIIKQTNKKILKIIKSRFRDYPILIKKTRKILKKNCSCETFKKTVSHVKTSGLSRSIL